MIILVTIVVQGQNTNLVINPSFETVVDFQAKPSLSNWTKCLKNDTPDYIEFTERGEPHFYYRKYIGGLLPYDGEAYAGIFCYRTNPLRGVDNVREFIQAPLMHKLEKDSVYQVSLVIALDPESNIAINNFDVLFNETPFSFRKEKDMFSLSPQVRFRGPVIDSISWIKYQTDFIATGRESWIILGNMLTDNALRKMFVHHESEMLQKWNMHDLEKAAYYYIDMVSVVKKYGLPEENPEDEQAKLLDPTEPLLEDDPDQLIEIGEVSSDSSIVLRNIFFEFDESDLLPASYKELDRFYEQLGKHREYSIVIEGHTDNMGTFEYNMELSERRAKAVVDYLIDRGLPQERVRWEAHGYTRPLSDNRTEKGRQLNRRVAFRIIRPDE